MDKAAFNYLLVIVEDASGDVWHGHARQPVRLKVLLRWRTAMGVPQVSMSNTAMHFKNQALRLVVETLGVSRRFTVANSP